MMLINPVPVEKLAEETPREVLGVIDNLSSLVLSELEPKRKLRAILESITEYIPARRCSFVFLGKGGRQGRVVAVTNPDPDRELSVALENYPEIRKALETGDVVLVENSAADELMAEVQDKVAEFGSSSILTAPIHLAGVIIGVLFIRIPPERDGFRPWEVDFCSILANMAASSLLKACLPDWGGEY